MILSYNYQVNINSLNYALSKLPYSCTVNQTANGITITVPNNTNPAVINSIMSNLSYQTLIATIDSNKLMSMNSNQLTSYFAANPVTTIAAAEPQIQLLINIVNILCALLGVNTAN